MPSAKYAKREVAYTDDHGDSDEQCSKCTYFRSPVTCEIVAGQIKGEGWCQKFVSRK